MGQVIELDIATAVLRGDVATLLVSCRKRRPKQGTKATKRQQATCRFVALGSLGGRANKQRAARASRMADFAMANFTMVNRGVRFFENQKSRNDRVDAHWRRFSRAVCVK